MKSPALSHLSLRPALSCLPSCWSTKLWVASPLPRQKFGWRSLYQAVGSDCGAIWRAGLHLWNRRNLRGSITDRRSFGNWSGNLFGRARAAKGCRSSAIFHRFACGGPQRDLRRPWRIFIVIPMMRTVIAPALKATLGFLPIFQGPGYGICFLTAGIVLAIMVIPYIISVSREVLLSVPRDQREAALALGSTRWESTWKMRFPLRAPASWARFFWRWRAHWEKPWR